VEDAAAARSALVASMESSKVSVHLRIFLKYYLVLIYSSHLGAIMKNETIKEKTGDAIEGAMRNFFYNRRDTTGRKRKVNDIII